MAEDIQIQREYLQLTYDHLCTKICKCALMEKHLPSGIFIVLDPEVDVTRKAATSLCYQCSCPVHHFHPKHALVSVHGGFKLPPVGLGI